MSQNNSTYNFAKDNSMQENPIRDLLETCVRNWYWFILSVLLSLVAGYLYYSSQTQMYSSQSVVLIKSDKNDGGMSESAIFSDLGVSNSGIAIENEILTLRSTALMEKVVRELGLDVTYTIKPFLRIVDIYGYSPIEVVFPDKEIMRGFNILISPLSATNYKYSVVRSGDDLKWINANFNDTVSVKAGKFVVETTPVFSNSAIGQDISVSLSRPRNMAKALVGSLRIKRDRGTNGLTISASGNNRQRTVDVLNSLIKVYNEDVINDKNRVARKTEQFIVERIADISSDLGGIDTRVEGLKKETNAPDLGSAAGMYMQEGNKYKSELIALETEYALAMFIRNYLTDPDKEDELIPANTGISDVGIESQITQYNALKLQYDKIVLNSGENNPVIKDLINSMNSTRSNMIQSIDNAISALQIKQEKAENQDNYAKRQIASVPTQEKMINDILRQQKIKEELYLYLLNKREENALNLAITESNAKVIEIADGGNAPFAPNRNNIMTFAALIGFALPALVIYLIFFIRSLDTKIHTKRDIEKLISIPIIGELPEKLKGQEKQEICISDSGRDRLSESFRVVRNNLDYVVKASGAKFPVIQIISTIPGEGKTYVSINMALSYAHTGKKVLLVDLDLRKGQLTKTLGVHGEGLSSYLSGKTDEIAVQRNIIHENLDLLGCGPIPPNPANLLMSGRLDIVIDKLKQQYDIIFIDSIPYSVAADAALINRLTDVTLYVMRNGKIDKRYLPELAKINQENRLKNMTIILTDVSYNVKRYDYGYGYGYGEDDNASKKNSKIKSKQKSK